MGGVHCGSLIGVGGRSGLFNPSGGGDGHPTVGPGHPQAAREVHGTLPFPGLPSIDVTVRGPVRTCNGCGRMQLLPSDGVRADLSAALTAALEAACVRTSFR